MIPILPANTVSDQLPHHQHQNFQTAAPVAVLPLPERVGSPGASSLASPSSLAELVEAPRSIGFYIDAALLLSFSSRRATQFDDMPADFGGHGRVAEWQTRWLQVPVSFGTWGFKSPFAHHEQFSSMRYIRSGCGNAV